MTRPGGLLKRRWPSPPIAVQVMALLLAGLVVAQTVTLGLTLLLPPAPAMHHTLTDIAAGLRGAAAKSDDDRPLIRTVETQPPSLQSPGWVASEPASADLARLLNVPREDVRLLFYAPPPFAGAETGRRVSLSARSSSDHFTGGLWKPISAPPSAESPGPAQRLPQGRGQS